MRTDLKTWPQLLPFGQPMPIGRSWRNFAVAVFASVVMHAFLAFLLWVAATDRAAVEPAASSIGTPLIVSWVSLSTLSTVSHDGPDRETISSVPHTGPPDEHSLSSPERSHSAEHKAEAETVLTSKEQGVPDSEAPEGRSLATGTTPSINLEAAFRIAREVGLMPEFETGTFATAKGQGVPGSEAPEGKTLATGTTPSIDLEAAYQIAREVGRMPNYEAQSPRFAQVTLNEKNHPAETGAPRLNCKTAYAKKGLLVIPLAIINLGCVW